MKQYFDVLGLPTDANQQQIKKQYRKLAMRLHPDKNPSPEAKVLFIKLTEAYDFLSKQSQHQPGLITDRKKEKTREERIKEAQIRFYNQQQKERLENEKYFQSLFVGSKWRILKLITFPGLILATLLIMDVYLPSRYEKTSIRYFEKEAVTVSSNNYRLTGTFHTKDGKILHLETMDFSLVNNFHAIQIEESFIFHLPKQIIANQGYFYSKHALNLNFYWGMFPLIVILLLPLFVRFFKRKTAFYTMIYHIALILSPSFLVYFLISDDHWAHLLTLGFL
jgi:hypothetical protein